MRNAWSVFGSSSQSGANHEAYPVVRPGARVEIHLLSGEPPLRGHVDSISHGITIRDNPNGPELLANVNPTFEWVRLAQRIPVRIQIDEIPGNVRISSGMTCTVVVATAPREWAIVSLIRDHLAPHALAAERWSVALRKPDEGALDRTRGPE